MIRLFQIGHVRLTHTMFPSDQYDLVYAPRISALGQSQDMSWTPNKRLSFGGRGFKSESFTIREVLINNSRYMADQRKAKFDQLIGLPVVDFIAYIPLNECAEWDILGNYDALYDAGVLWVYNTGYIKSVKPDHKNHSIEIECEVQNFWEPINRFLWQFTPTPGGMAFSSEDGTLSALPITYNDFTFAADWMWSRKFYENAFYLFDPDIWETWHTELPEGYPITGWGTNWTTETAFSFTNPFSGLFAGLSRSLYQWTGLPDGGSIILSVTHGENLWNTRTSIASLHLGILNTDLNDAGYTGLLDDDILVVANYNQYNSFVLRDNVIITEVYPRWNYNSPLLGSTGMGNNILSLTYPIEGVLSAQLHNFRII